MKQNDIVYIDWWENNCESGLEKVKKFFPVEIPKIYYPIINKFINHNQLKNFQENYYNISLDIFSQYSSVPSDRQRKILMENLEVVFQVLENLESVEERINLLEKFQGSEQTKSKIFTLPILNDLLNYSYTNLLSLFIKFQEAIENSPQSNVTLTAKIIYLAGKKRTIAYQDVVDIFSSNIRNAMSHGGVTYSDTKVIFKYIENNQEINKQYTYFELKDNLYKLFDALSGIFVGWVRYLCDLNVDFIRLKDSDLSQETLDKVFKLSMSTLNIECKNIQVINIMGDSTRRQLNLEFTHPNLDIDSRIYFALQSAIQMWKESQLENLQSVCISYTATRCMNSFIRISKEIITDLIAEEIDFRQALSIIIENNEIMISEANDETRNEVRDLFQGYTDIFVEGSYLISEIYDSSLEKQKRFVANLYLGDIRKKNLMKNTVIEAVEQLKVIENFGSPQNRVKHGEMEADIVFLAIYENKFRRGENKEQSSDNPNFIGLVQYDVDKHFPIADIAMRGKLNKQRVGNYEFSWNTNLK